MVDRVTTAQRSNLMGRIKSKNTRPEVIVRKTVYSIGFRYRLNVKDLPGKPDLVFRPLKKAIFVHGCFWHQHQGCEHCHIPKSNLAYWEAKLQKTVQRDANTINQLESIGWSVMVVWECEVKYVEAFKKKLISFLCRKEEGPS